MKSVPNILFLMGDEHRYDVAGFAGNTVRTPFLDRLAQRGTVFTNAYAPNPMCVPSRQCMMAGKYIHSLRDHGVRHYGSDLPAFYPTWAWQFSRHAWMTTACGKLHHMGRDQMQGWRRRFGGDCFVSEPFIDQPVQEAFDRYRLKKRCPGDFWDRGWSAAKEIRRAGAGISPLTHSDEYTTTGAIQFVKDYFCSPVYDDEDRDRPLLLKVSLHNPHYPFIAPEERFSYYLNRIKSFANQQTFPHPGMCYQTGADRPVSVGSHGEVSERDVCRATAAYYANVEEMDARFQRIIDALEHAGENMDEWIIVYASDHGEMLGEHGLWFKASFFEGSVRIPLIISWPRRFSGGRRVNENVNLVDLYATLCELAGIPVPSGLDSRSLVPLLEGGSNQWNDETYSHFGDGNLMIKRGNLKYQSCSSDRGCEPCDLLFDLAVDPGETRDFSADAKYADDMAYFRVRKRELGYETFSGK